MAAKKTETGATRSSAEPAPTLFRNIFGDRPGIRFPEVPVSLFGAVMGIAGLGHAWRKSVIVLHTPPWIGELLILMGALLFALTAIAYGVKIARAPERIRAEIADLQQINFFATISLSLLLLAGGALPMHQGIAGGLWVVGATLQFALALAILGQWFRGQNPREALSPSLFLPVAGIALGPVVGVPLGYIEASRIMFATGLVFWPLVLVLLSDRLFLRQPLDTGRLPTIAITMTPPALLFMSYVQLNPTETLGYAGSTLFYAAFLFFLLNVTLIDRFLRAPFSVSWWAFTFPVAAVTSAAMDYHMAEGTQFPVVLCALLLIITTIVVGYTAARTILGLIAGTLLPELADRR